jgi:Flp pilus assembly protein TadD
MRFAMQYHQDKISTLSNLLAYLRQDPANDKLRIAVFDAALAVGQFDEANFQVVHALHIRPNDVSWRDREAALLLARGDYVQAQRKFALLIDDGVNDPAIRYNLAYAVFAQGRMAEAMDLVGALLVEAGETGDLAWALWLRCQHHLAHLEDGLAALSEAAAVRALPADVWGVASLMALDANRMIDAAAWSQRALKDNPAQFEALVTRATLALTEAQMETAKSLFERALQINGTDGRSWSGLAFAYLRETNFTAALEAFKKAVTYMPDHIGTWIGLGWAELFANRAEAARHTFEQALSLDRNFGESHGSLAVALARLSFPEEARSEIGIALRLDRRCLSARYAQAILSGEADDPEAFRRLSRRVLAERSAGSEGSGAKILADLILAPQHRSRP